MPLQSEKEILGIDVGKEELVIFNTALAKTVCLPNTQTALEQTLQETQWSPTQYVVGLESTGDFSLLPAKFFLKKGFRVKLLNPIVVKKFIHATIRQKKTDKSDAEVIAEVIHYGEGQEITEKELDLAKKTNLRLERKLTKIRSDPKRIQGSLKIKSAQGISLEKTQREIDRLIRTVDKARERIWQIAQEEPADRQEEIISSHPGCGQKLSVIISTEAGDIKRFPSAKQLKAYAGIDPRVIQSGKMDKRGRMTKRGNPFLRQALFLAAFVASNHDPELKEYYQKKRAEGKSHIHAVCTVARKLCERIYATVSQDRLYEVRGLSTWYS